MLAAMIALLCLAANSQPVPVTEYQVKAAFLYNFARFVEWPSTAFSGQDAQLQICVYGPDPFGEDLRSLTHDKLVNGRRLLVKDVVDLQQARSCQIVFIARPEKIEIAKILQSLQGANVLTVGEAKGFADNGGMINFILQNEHVQFEVNHREAKRAGLTISSRLLSVARAVIE